MKTEKYYKESAGFLEVLMGIIVVVIIAVISVIGYDRWKNSDNVPPHKSDSNASYSAENNKKQATNQTSSLGAIHEENYPALSKISQETVLKDDGYYGLIRIFSRHYLNGMNNERKKWNVDFVVQGAGGIISIDGNLYVLTARHNVIPNAGIKKIQHSPKSVPTEIQNISALQSQILIGGFGIQPKTITLNKDEDVCILSISDQDRDKILKSYNRDKYAPIPITNAKENPSGMTAEVWGFPAQHNPQVEHVLVSAKGEKFLSLNKALLRGYSGGPVFILNNEKNKKVFAGIITRADDQANQSIVLPFALFNHMFNYLTKPKESSHSIFDSIFSSDKKETEKYSNLISIKQGDEVSLDNISYKYLNYP